MQANKYIVLCICLAFIIPAMQAAPVEIVGVLRNVNAQPLSGIITLFHSPPNSMSESHEVDETGVFHIVSDSVGELLVHVMAPGHPSQERVLPAAVTGRVTMNFTLPLGQDIRGRVVDQRGNGVPDAIIRVLYNEPGKPTRKVTFEQDIYTDGNGEFLCHDVGILVPFYIDVLAPKYPPAQSKRFKLDAGDTKLDDIVLGELGAEVVVTVLGKDNFPVKGMPVTLFADPRSYPDTAHGS